MQRLKVVGGALVALGLIAVTAPVFAQHQTKFTDLEKAPVLGPASECKIVYYCSAVPAQVEQRGKEQRKAVMGRDITARGLEASTLGAATVPPLMWREPWQTSYTTRPTGPGDTPGNDLQRLVTLGRGVVTNPQLELKVYGPNAQNLLVYDMGAFNNLWTGISAPVVVMLRDKTSFAEISKLARMKVTVRTFGLHRLHPVVKLADGTFLIGSKGIDTEGDFLENEILFNVMRWFFLDQERVLVMREVFEPDLSKVDEVGVADIAPAGGHQGAGWMNISTLELYANPVKR